MLVDAMPPIDVPLPMENPSLEFYSDAMVELLRRLDIEYVFLVPGSSYRGLHDSLVNFGGNRKPRIILCTHEQIAVSMAHGYAKATGRIGVCILHDLVGLMNGSMGVYNAYGDNAPVMILGGSGPLDPADRRWIDWLHCASTQADVVKKFVKWTEEPTTPQWHLDAIAKAYKIAMTGPRGPVYVTLDCGVQEQRIDGDCEIPDTQYYQPSLAPAANPQLLEAAANALLNAQLPLIVGGRFGIRSEGVQALVDLVELTGALYQDDNAIVGFPTAHPQNVCGDREIVKEADVVVAIDCRDLASLLDGYTDKKDFIGSGGFRQGRIVIDMSLNELVPKSWSGMAGRQPLVDLQINCDPLLAMQQLVSVIRQRLEHDSSARSASQQRRDKATARHAQVRKRQRATALKGWDDTPITPARMVAEVWEAVRQKDWLLAMRNQASFPEGVWDFPGAGWYLGANGGGGVGYGPGAAAGAAIACRDSGKFCVAIMGDGDFAMASGAIWSAVHNQAPMLLVINNNTTWGNDEKHQMHVARERKRPIENACIGQRMIDPCIDHASVARSHGAWAEGPVINPNDLASVLRAAVSQVEQGRVAVVEVRTQLV